MTTYAVDNLFVLAEATPFIEKLETALQSTAASPQARAWAAAGHITKLLQDVGVQIDREIGGYDPTQPAPGPESARLNAAYEPVTGERVQSVLQSAYAHLIGSQVDPKEKTEMRASLKAILEKLQVPVPKTDSAPEASRSPRKATPGPS